MTFKKGETGNKLGRPKGSGYATKLRNSIEADLPHIIESLVEAAKSGDVGAAKLLLSRTLPAIKPTSQTIGIGKLRGKSLTDQGSTIIDAMATGKIPAIPAYRFYRSLT